MAEIRDRSAGAGAVENRGLRRRCAPRRPDLPVGLRRIGLAAPARDAGGPRRDHRVLWSIAPAPPSRDRGGPASRHAQRAGAAGGVRELPMSGLPAPRRKAVAAPEPVSGPTARGLQTLSALDDVQRPI